MEERLVPTGEKIKQFLQEKGLKQKILVEKGNYSKKQVSKVLSSRLPLSPRFAHCLSSLAPEMSATAWLNYDRRYRSSLSLEEPLWQKAALPPWLSKNDAHKIIDSFNLPLEEGLSLLQNGLPVSSLFPSFPYTYSPLVPFFKKEHKATARNVFLLGLFLASLPSLSRFQGTRYLGERKLKSELLKAKKSLAFSSSEELVSSEETLLGKVGICFFRCAQLPLVGVKGLLYEAKGQVFLCLSQTFSSLEEELDCFLSCLFHFLSPSYRGPSSVYCYPFPENKEEEAKSLQKDYCLDPLSYRRFVSARIFEKKAILSFSESQAISPGYLVYLLHQDKVLEYAALRSFLHPKKRK